MSDFSLSEDALLNHVMMTRYGEALHCPKCKKYGKFSRITGIPAFQCAWCGHHIHPMVGTPFERSRTPLKKWFFALQLLENDKEIPAVQLQSKLGVTYKCAWRMKKLLLDFLN